MKKYALFLFLLPIPTLHAMDDQSGKKHIVVDVDFMVEPDTTAAAKEIGVWGICSALVGSMIHGNKLEESMPQFFTILRNINSNPSPQKITWQQQEAPVQIYDAISGRRKSNEILSETMDRIKQQQLNNATLMSTFARITFDPVTNTRIMKTVASAVALLQELRKQNHTLHLMGNWNPEAYPLLEKKFTQEFQLFNGQKLLSGQDREAKLVKGPEMYKKLFELSGALPEQTIFIESEEHAIGQLNTLTEKPCAILYQKPDLSSLRSELIKLGALPSK